MIVRQIDLEGVPPAPPDPEPVAPKPKPARRRRPLPPGAHETMGMSTGPMPNYVSYATTEDWNGAWGDDWDGGDDGQS